MIVIYFILNNKPHIICSFIQIDEEIQELVSRVRLEEGNTEFWKKRFLGEGLEAELGIPTAIEAEASEVSDNPEDDANKQPGDDDDVDKEEAVEPTEIQAGDTEAVKDKEVAANPLQMIGVQLFKGPETAPAKSKKSFKKLARIAAMEVCDMR